MRGILVLTLAWAIGSGSAALATDLNLKIEELGSGSSTIAVGAGCHTGYRVVGELNDAASDGLALVAFDLEFDGGELPRADLPVDPLSPMQGFVAPAGLTNPQGFGGAPVGGRLVQVGGAQNVLVHGQWDCETGDDCPEPSTCVDAICTAVSGLPLGTLALGVAQPGAPVVIATGRLTAPATPGTYFLGPTHLVSNVIEKGAFGLPFWKSHAAGAGSMTELTITVESGGSCLGGYDDSCCLDGESCTVADPVECVELLGGAVGTAAVCELDLDGDGVDGACGDACPEDAGKLESGVCGCGVPDVDSDGDAVLDCLDACPEDPEKQEPGICGCGVPDIDRDIDTVLDCLDQCPGQDDLLDEDGDGTPDCLEGPAVIPAASGWSLVVMTALLLAVFTVFFGRRRQARSS